MQISDSRLTQLFPSTVAIDNWATCASVARRGQVRRGGGGSEGVLVTAGRWDVRATSATREVVPGEGGGKEERVSRGVGGGGEDLRRL
jgi:hypothetical protein